MENNDRRMAYGELAAVRRERHLQLGALGLVIHGLAYPDLLNRYYGRTDA
jgi:hypothetical protein